MFFFGIVLYRSNRFRSIYKLYSFGLYQLQEANTTNSDIELSNLESDALYRILVYARNDHGTSLPSSMLLINTTDNGASSFHFELYELFSNCLPLLCRLSTVVKETDSNNYGVPSPPHSLAISSHSATYVTIAWQPPEYSHLHEPITYQ